jgi:hypothetical protein
MGEGLLGCTEPRLFTPPLRPLTPETTLGFEFIDFAEQVVGIELLPWQRWWALHAFELLPDGRFRFRTIVTLVARQNGKTILMKLVALWQMYMGHAREVLGAAQTRDVAKDTWLECLDVVDDVPDLKAELAGPPRMANGEENFKLLNGARYRITAANRKGGRSKSIDLLVFDEIRELLDFDAWGALSKTTNARPNSMKLTFSNAGDARSVVLKTLRASGLSNKSRTVGLFEWSAPEGCSLDDRDAWAQANPALGYTIDEESIESDMVTDPPAVFRTEVLCQEVDSMADAVDLTAWKSMADDRYVIEELSDPRVVLGVEVSIDGAHVALVAAALSPEGLYYVEPVAGWESPDLARTGTAEDISLAEWVTRIKPAAIAWLPGGPAGVLGVEIRGLAGRNRFGDPIDPAVVDVVGVGVKEACQGLADLVAARRVAHPPDPMLDAHMAGAQRLDSGDGWRFARRGAAPIDGVYATAAAVHVLRTLPEPPKRRSFVY